MSALAFASIPKGRGIDRTLGDLTYPLYLYHEDVLVVILTVTTGYAYSTLVAAFVVSFATAAILMAVVDPAATTLVASRYALSVGSADAQVRALD